MKEFLFLYPIQEYLNACIGREAIRKQHGWDLCQKFNDIIEARYRQRGFGVNWLMFSNRCGSQNPDLLLLAEEIVIKPQDKILSSEVPFVFMTAFNRYPNPVNILAQLPKDIEELVLGGFHQWDCVDKLAQVAHEQGIPTIVDEDTTEVFFREDNSYLSIPLIRDTFPFNTDGMSTALIAIARENRSSKPWFTQI